MDVYLDHHATTPCDPAVLEAMLPWFTEKFGNASSRSHAWGYTARTAVETARGQLATAIGASPKAIVFTSGATEANNLAILGTLRAGRPKAHMVTVTSEHKAVLDAATQAEAEGYRVTRVLPESDGRVDPEAIEAAIASDTALVSVMWANNETGTLQPIEAIAAVCQFRGVRFHSDAAQALSTQKLGLDGIGVDLVSLSAHKAYGPKGIGALYVRRGRPRLTLQPLIFGGGHERGMRSGTLPVPLVVGFGEAARRVGEDAERLRALRDELEAALLAIDGVSVNGSRSHRLPHSLNVRFSGVESKTLMMACRSIAMSSGSACTSESLSPSHVLRSMGLPPETAGESVRFGLGRSNTPEQLAWVASEIALRVSEIRALGDGL